jgi:osmotically inducible lipoprotein OsmB
MRHSRVLLAASLLASMAFTGCETTGQNTLLGAGTGAAIAAATGHSPLRGAAIGAASGFVVGKVLKHERERAYEEGYYDRDYGYSRGGYPRGHRSSRRGIVRSPYAPFNDIDVRGIPSGAKVLDPSCNRVFINP